MVFECRFGAPGGGEQWKSFVGRSGKNGMSPLSKQMISIISYSGPQMSTTHLIASSVAGLYMTD